MYVKLNNMFHIWSNTDLYLDNTPLTKQMWDLCTRLEDVDHVSDRSVAFFETMTTYWCGSAALCHPHSGGLYGLTQHMTRRTCVHDVVSTHGVDGIRHVCVQVGVS